MRWHILGALVAPLLIVAAITEVSPAAKSPQSGARPITADDFHQAALRGFGDRNNSWAQSMVWWRKHLYVGTTRQSLCGSLFAVWEFAFGLFGREFADTYLPYPPHSPDLECAPDGADLSLQAEIWRWTPGSDSWDRVYQSPLELDNPGAGPSLPPPIGKKLPWEIAFRGLSTHTDPDGTEALYAFSANATVMWDRTKLPPPRILRSTDGVIFTPIPQTPGTFLGDLPFNPDHSSYRSPVSFGGKLFVLSGPIFGQGSLIGSADPALGDNAWFLASPPAMLFYEMAKFNGYLYLGTFNPFGGGYSIVKTRAEGTPPYEFVTVVPTGAFHPDPVRASKSVVSMHEYRGRLYVGTATQTEIIRINPDDTWDLVIGPPRVVPLPGGGSEPKYPLSGLDAGFGHSLNDHAWQMDDTYGFLYVGTYNASIASKNDPVNGPLLAHNMGAHLYRTPDGWYYSAITTNGFADPSDPQGGPFDFGIRTMAITPHGMFLGTANDSYGLAIFRAKPRGSDAPDPPDRLEIEQTTGGSALLSWTFTPKHSEPVHPGPAHFQAIAEVRGVGQKDLKKQDRVLGWQMKEPPPVKSYQVWRAEVHSILVRDDLNFEGWNGISGTKIPDTYVGPYELIGTPTNSFYIDETVQTGKRYMYYVVQVHQGRVSDQSNLVAFPLLNPAMTFARLGQEVDRLDQRGRFRNGVTRLTKVRSMIAAAQELAAGCQIGDALQTLNPQKASTAVLDPDAIDLEVLMSKLGRRLALFEQLPLDVSTDEFCMFQ